MICHPYKPFPCDRSDRGSLRHAVLTGIVSCVMVCLLVIAAPARGQWVCGPMWGSPPVGSPSADSFAPPPYVIVGQPYAQTGPALPPIIIDDAPSTSTSYPPVDSVLPPIADVEVSCLDSIGGQLRVVVPEAFLNRLLARSDSEAGPVTDFILGANVTGSQNTDTCLRVDVQPSDCTARLVLQLTGTTVNQTIGVTPQAAVRSRGNHDFRITKQIDFDGLKFTTRSPAAWVTPRLTNEAAQTMFTGVPLIGPVANQIALTEADRQRPTAELIVTQRVTDQAAPRFNSEVDHKLADANIRLRDFAPQALAMAGLRPEDVSLASTDGRLLYGLTIPARPSRLPEPVLSIDPSPADTAQPPDDDADFVVIRQIGQRDAAKNVSVERRAFLPPPGVVEGTAFTIAVHEDIANHVLQQLPLGGLAVPDRTIDRLLDVLVGVLADLSLSGVTFEGLGGDEPEFATILLASEDALTVRFESGQVIVTAHAGFRPLGTPDVPTQRIEIPYAVSTDDGRFTLVPGAVKVVSVSDAPANPLEEIARPIIQQQVAQRLQALSLPSSFPLALTGMSPTTLTLHELTLSDGWLIIAVD